MQANDKFKQQTPEFWSIIRLLNQRLGYHQRKSKKNPNPRFRVPTPKEITTVFQKENLDETRLINTDYTVTTYGQLVIDYLQFRSDILYNEVEPNLMDQPEAKALFYDIKKRVNPSHNITPMNKQSGEKRDYNYLTGIINMLVSEKIGETDFNYDPKELTGFTKDSFPVRTLARRLDGAYPSIINPKAVWEIKEYYYTTTFGSRISDGIYETMLDGHELDEVYRSLGIKVKHYLFTDAKYTWWGMGKSYLCRMVDIIHMGLVDEIIFGREVITRVPELVDEWIATKN